MGLSKFYPLIKLLRSILPMCLGTLSITGIIYNWENVQSFAKSVFSYFHSTDVSSSDLTKNINCNTNGGTLDVFDSRDSKPNVGILPPSIATVPYNGGEIYSCDPRFGKYAQCNSFKLRGLFLSKNAGEYTFGVKIDGKGGADDCGMLLSINGQRLKNYGKTDGHLGRHFGDGNPILTYTGIYLNNEAYKIEWVFGCSTKNDSLVINPFIKEPSTPTARSIKKEDLCND